MYKTFVILMAALVGGWTPMVQAGQCFVNQRNRVVQRVVQNKAQQRNNKVQVVQNVVNNHQRQRLQVVDQVRVNQKVVEFDRDYFLGQEGYFDVADQLRFENQRVQQVQQNKTIEKQQEQIDKLLKIVNELVKKKSEEPKPVAPPNDTPVINPPSPVVGSNALDLKVFRIFKTNCASCHTGDSARKGFKLIGKAGSNEYLFNLSLQDRVIVHDVVSGKNLRERGKKLMPLGGPKLSDSDIEILRLWMVKEAENVKSQLEG